LGTAITGLSTASAAAGDTENNRVSPVTGALPNSEEDPIGTITYSEGSDNEFFAPGAQTQVDLTLSAGAEFTAGITPTITVPEGYSVYGTSGVDDSPLQVSDGDDTYTFFIEAPSTPQMAVVTVRGLEADVTAAEGTAILLTSNPGDTNPVLKVLDRERIGGVDRYETAAKAFRAGDYPNSGGWWFSSGSDVVLASGQDYPDALSANFLAGQLDTGILLTRSGSLPSDARKAILDECVGTVYIAGGTGAVSQAVEDEIESLYVCGYVSENNTRIRVVRLGGADRYATNRKINQFAETVLPATSNTALIATGRGFADALAMGPVAYRAEYPLILVPGTDLGTSGRGQLQDFNPDNVVIAGGTAAVSESVEAEIEATYDDEVARYGGADRTETAGMIADWADRSLDFGTENVYIANGSGFADALAGGPLAGQNNEVILLAKSKTTLGSGTEDFLGDRTVEDIDTLTALGLTGVTPTALMEDAANAVGVDQVPTTTLVNSLMKK
jgi:putative cell wall-binding protein